MPTATELLKLGYSHLISVVPPNGTISPNSNLKPEALGKVPGRRNGRGEWAGYDWRSADPVDAGAAAKIDGSGANVGLRTDFFPAVDIDCTDPALSQLIAHQALMHLGLAPVRIGRAPKALLLYRTNESFGRMRLWIGKDQLVEILGDGQQFVAAGTHPGTRKAYEWPQGLLPADDLTIITRDEADAFLEALAADADMLGYEVRREGAGAVTTDRATIDQGALRGDYDRIKAALALIPNDEENFPGRDDYLRMGYAVKAALGDKGIELFLPWAMQWPDATVDTVEADWGRMKPPFEVGADYVYETARPFGLLDAADDFTATAVAAPAPEAAPELAGGAGGPIQYSDAALANLLVRVHGARLHFCPEQNSWMAWNGQRWLNDGDSQAAYLCGLLCQKMSNHALMAITKPDKADMIATRLAGNGCKNSVLSYASSYPTMQIHQNELDSNPYLLNTPGGMVDLRTGALSKHEPREYMTRMTAVTPDFEMATPTWNRFLFEATAGDKELQAYLQRLVGYAITGLKTEHNLAFLYGSGGNGKGVFLNTIAGILADYGKAASMDTFTASKFDRHPTDMAGLAGARMVTAQETQEGRSWDEQKVKMLTSEDKVQARFMREDFFEFVPTFKLIFAGNHKPEIRNLDDAMRRRFHLVPFTVKPKHVDTELPEKLKAEWPGILAWAVRGSAMWMHEGLNPPASVIEATQEYFDEEDPIGQWIKDRVQFDPKSTEVVPIQTIFDNWNEWCGENGERGRNPKALSRILRERGGFISCKTREFRGFRGIKLIAGPMPGAEFTI